MSRQGKEYLQELVDAVVCIPGAFRIKCGNGKYLLTVTTNDQETTDYFAVSAIYETICSVDEQIKYAFDQAVSCDLPETLEGYNPFSKPDPAERIAIYHAENIVFRVSVLWDLLAQLCNVIYYTGLKPREIHYNRYFENHASGEKAFDIAREVYAYLKEKDDPEADVNPWPGNHAFLNDFRNQMTHRISPNISSISSFGETLRPPTLYVLQRAIEDYYKVSSFLCRLINQFLEERKDWAPIGMELTHE